MLKLIPILLLLISCTRYSHTLKTRTCPGKDAQWRSEFFDDENSRVFETKVWGVSKMNQISLKSILKKEGVSCQSFTHIKIETISKLSDTIIGLLPFISRKTLKITTYYQGR